MSNINIGNKSIINVYIGENKISKIYLGDILLYNATEELIPSQDVKIDTYTNLEDNEKKTIIWTAGIIPPKVGKNLTKDTGGDFTRMEIPTSTSPDVTYETPYIPNNGWYSFTKTQEKDNDDNLCFMASAVNSLYWWLDRNKEYIDRFIKLNEGTQTVEKLKEFINKDRPQNRPPLWMHYLTKLGARNQGLWCDQVQDNFINGYRFRYEISENYASDKKLGVNNELRDGPKLLENGPNNSNPSQANPLCGFFFDVFKEKRLTNRKYYDRFEEKSFGEDVKKCLLSGNQLNISYYLTMMGWSGHQITVWGAEFNKDGTINALFLSDNNDQGGNIGIGMYRSLVTYRRDMVYLTTKKDKSGGAQIIALNFLYRGDEYWKSYLRNKGGGALINE